MKTVRLFTAILLLAFTRGIHAQTADQDVTQGRAYLAATNIIAANASFSNAVALSPTNQTANFFYAATSLLVLPSQPAGSNFLTRWGAPVSGRNIYAWTAVPPKDSNGVPIAPAGVNADEATSLLRTNILSALVAAGANLAVITDTNFSVSLTSGETRTVAVTVDYGDVQMLRAMIQAGEYFIYSAYSWNTSAQLTVIRSLYTNSQFSLGGLLSDFPQLLTFATTNDLGAAQNAFVNGVNYYLTASQIIRDRPPGTIRLFNYDADDANKELQFRLTISDLVSSLSNGIVPLEINSNYSVFLPSEFTGTHTLRSFFPQFQGQGFVLGTLPDVTFGGLFYGAVSSKIEQFLARELIPIPNIVSGAAASGQTLQFPVHGLAGRGYVIQTSTDLVTWSNYAAFASFGGTYNFNDPAGRSLPHRFYRVLDSTTNMPPPANGRFANRVPLTGLEIQTSSYLANATAESDEPGSGQPSVWWSWTAPSSGLVVASAAGSQGNVGGGVYTGTTLASLSVVPNVNGLNNFIYDGYPFLATVGTTYQIQVSGYAFGNTGAVQLEIGVPPVLNVSSPSGNGFLSAPTNLAISASASETQGTIVSVKYSADEEFYPYTSWSGSATGSSLNAILTNLPPATYSITETASDLIGISTSTQQTMNLIGLQVTTASLPGGTHGMAYSGQLSAVNGQPPYVWSVASGSLPPGLTLATNGLISGIPTAAGSYYFIVQVKDSLATPSYASLSLTVF